LGNSGNWDLRTISDLGAEGDVLLGGACGFLWRHGEFAVLSDLLLYLGGLKVRLFFEELIVWKF
jgi:hypothetical protein